MSISYKISQNHAMSQGRNEDLPKSVAKKPPLLDNEVHILVLPPQGGFIWTTGQFIQPR